jgi:hypothetical protein
MTTDKEAILRGFETDVLDTFHTSLPLWSLDLNEAIYGLMAAFDTMILPMEEVLSQITSEDIGSLLSMKFWQEGFNQALRWLTIGGLTMPTPVADGELLDKGGEFLLYTATKYIPVASMHVAYSRGSAAIEVDEEARSIRFIRLPSPGYSAPWYNFAEVTIKDAKGRKEERRRSIVMSEAEESLTNIRVEIHDGTLRFDPHVLLTPEILRLADMVRNTETITFDAQTDLVGFSLAQFRSFWRVLFAWSIGALMIFRSLAYGGAPQENYIPTQIVPRDKFLADIGDISNLPSLIVLEIVKRLSYIPGEKADIFLQPLLCSVDLVAWSPLTVQLSKEERNFLKLMARSRHLQGQAANIIGSRERTMLREFGLFLAKRAGYDFTINRIIRHRGEEAEIDLLAYNKKHPTEVLLVEGKAILALDDIGEILGASSELQRAQEQIRRATRIMRTMSLEQKAREHPFVAWEKVESFYGIVLTPDSYPPHQVDQSEIPFVTIRAMRQRLRDRDLQSPSTIWSACREKIWIANIILPIESFETINIGDVTYEIPMVGEKESE